jgi:hypothetical protein
MTLGVAAALVALSGASAGGEDVSVSPDPAVPMFFGSAEAGTGTGAEAGSRTDVSATTGGPGAGAVASGAGAAVSFGSEGAGSGPEACETDGARGARADGIGVGTGGTTAAADPAAWSGGVFGLEAMGMAEMTRGTFFGAARMSVGCCSPLVRDVWLELRR